MDRKRNPRESLRAGSFFSGLLSVCFEFDIIGQIDCAVLRFDSDHRRNGVVTVKTLQAHIRGLSAIRLPLQLG